VETIIEGCYEQSRGWHLDFWREIWEFWRDLWEDNIWLLWQKSFEVCGDSGHVSALSNIAEHGIEDRGEFLVGQAGVVEESVSCN
jgi:hypothetical protein